MTQQPKEVAGRRAAEMVADGMLLGLGTGSTVNYALIRIAERIRDERLSLRGVPTSRDTEQKARELGIPLVDLTDAARIDLTIDGADEIDARFDMIKGGGGALLREKVVAAITTTEVICVGADKVVERLGRHFLLPVEVVPFARSMVVRALGELDAQPSLRIGERGAPFITDNQNEILDCRFPGGIEDAAGLERRLKTIPGLVESGLFIGLADVLVIGHPNGEAEVRERPR